MMPPGSTPSAFSFELRASCCYSCGQALTGGDGSRIACTRCGQPLDLRPRNGFLRAGGAPLPGAQPPQFRAQDGRPLLPPPNIAFLWENGALAPHREPEALMAWQGARQRAATDIGAGEELCFLTRALVVSAEAQGDLLRVRALIEAALEHIQLPRHRAILLGMITRAAVRAGDVQSAMGWLSGFEPPQELESDSEHRVTTAVVATARGDFPTVLQAVGQAFDQIAIQDALDPQADVFRINALECSGRVDEARQQLQAGFAKGPGMRNALERIQQQYRAIPLCRASMPAVQASHEQRGRSNAGSGKIAMGRLLIGVSILPLVLTTFFGLQAFLATGSMQAFFPVPFTLIAVVAFGGWGLRTLKMGKRERQVFEKGVRAAARVMGAAPTGVSVNNIPEIVIQLEVQLTPPIHTQIRMLMHPGQQHILAPGTMLYVRVDPAQPDVAVLDQ
jgi:hypothetical protein